jgi:hypothetical protein
MKNFGNLHLALRSRKLVIATILFSLFVLSGPFATANGQTRQGCDLGTVWDEFEVGGWNGTWTRRGNSSTFDAVYRLSGYEDVISVLNISISGNSVSISRTDSSGESSMSSCRYEGKISSDGVSVSGSYSCVDRQGNTTPTYSWKATIRCSNLNISGVWIIKQGSLTGILYLSQTGNNLSGSIDWDSYPDGTVESGSLINGKVRFVLSHTNGVKGTYLGNIRNSGKSMADGTTSGGGTTASWYGTKK